MAAGPGPFEEATAFTMLATVAARLGDREAIVFGDERIRYGELLARTETLARGLSALGVGHDDKVAIWLPNRPAWFATQLACARLGAVVVALNPRYRAHELSYILAQSDARVLLLTDHLGPVDYFEILHDVLPELPAAVPGELAARAAPVLRHVVVDADDPYPGCLRLADVLDLAEGATLPVGPTPDDLFALLYTSGTTSFPKGAMISHRNCVPHAWHCGERLRFTARERVLHAMPAAGTWGGVNIPLTTWSHGGCLVLMDTWDPVRALALIEREGCTVFNAVDTMVKPMLDHPALDRYDRGTLRTGGFAATGGGGPAMFDAFVARIGVPLAYQPYGMTEVNALALLHDLSEPLAERARAGTTPAPGVEARVVDIEGHPCAPGQAGELQFRGPRVTRGYYKKPDETAAAFTADGWFRTGDLAVPDADGRVEFRGRLRETLRISHFMVAPGEIEALLMSHPGVEQAFVVGIPDPHANEVPVAYVILGAGAATLTEDALREWCRGRVASYKIPRAIRFVVDVPRTPSPHGEKVQRGKLREQALLEFGDATVREGHASA
jgi:fatty-acyl-CoA synthase